MNPLTLTVNVWTGIFRTEFGSSFFGRNFLDRSLSIKAAYVALMAGRLSILAKPFLKNSNCYRKRLLKCLAFQFLVVLAVFISILQLSEL